MKTVSITIYEFHELPELTQTKIINDTLNSMAEHNTIELGNFAIKAQEKAEAMLTPWFYLNYLWEYGEESIRKNWIENSYYTEDGRFYSVI